MKNNITLLLSALLLLVWLAAPAVAADDNVLAKGVWTKKTKSISGSWSIVERDGSKFLVLDEKFKTKSAPDLKFYLSPLPIIGAGNSNATHGAALIAPVANAQGPLEVKIPSNLDLDKYMSVIILSEQDSKLWGGANLAG